jgi:hypothetical protein
MGSGALLRGLPDYLESSLGLPVEVFDPIPSLDLTALPEKTAEALKQDQGGMAVTLGLAQMAADETAFRVEVLPESDRKKRRFLQHTAFSIVAAALLFAGLAVSWVMLSSASAEGRGEVKTLQDTGATYAKNDADMASARKRVEDANAEMHQVGRVASLGPAAQLLTDLVHSIVNAAAGGYPEIQFTRISAKFVTVQAPGDVKAEPARVPQVEFEASVKSVGARDPSTAYSSFVGELQKSVLDLKTFKPTIGQRVDKDSTFKFEVRGKAPFELESEEKR